MEDWEKEHEKWRRQEVNAKLVAMADDLYAGFMAHLAVRYATITEAVNECHAEMVERYPMGWYSIAYTYDEFMALAAGRQIEREMRRIKALE